MMECIKQNGHREYGLFPKTVYDYIVLYHGQERAHSILKEADMEDWQYDHETEIRVPNYIPIGDINESRFNKILINAIKNTKTSYIVVEGRLSIDEYDNLEKRIILTF